MFVYLWSKFLVLSLRKISSSNIIHATIKLIEELEDALDGSLKIISKFQFSLIDLLLLGKS